jgi:hypothetical protein
VVRDAANATVWSSLYERGSAGSGQGWLYQITSQGLPGVSCIFSGPAPAAVKLVAADEAYALQILQEGAQLGVRGADGSQVCAPAWGLPLQAYHAFATAVLCRPPPHPA